MERAMRAPIHELHASNLLTYLALVAAVGAALAAVDGRHPAFAGAALALAVIADTFDGRFARSFARTERQANIGHDLDSLVDAIAFGLAPVMVLAAVPIAEPGGRALVWWMAASIYTVAAVSRLAFYNVMGDEARFVGLPAPAAALLCATSLLVPVPAWAAPWPLLVGGAAMIAPFSFPRPRGLALAAFVLWAAGLMVTLAVA
jgi:CDP-diacylglycerol--serine O-phosphatidyltransferase